MSNDHEFNLLLAFLYDLDADTFYDLAGWDNNGMRDEWYPKVVKQFLKKRERDAAPPVASVSSTCGEA